ncbi:MAG TPA: TonB-dependent receptor [Caulobacteraceae bacterium]
MKHRYFRGASAATVALAVGGWSASAYAATAAATGAATPQPSEVTEVVVTGSYIQGTPKDAALPVNVITSEDLIKQGSPSTLELIKNLPASSGVLGDANQFDSRSQGSEGTSSINLRGLGPARTLVLLNGRRLTLNPRGGVGGGVDTNMLPAAAIQRVEVLKDGAAATYGSDAIGGVVNFITKKNQHGFDINGSYSHIRGSNGDYTAGLVAGWQNQDVDALVTFGYQHRSELRVIARDWAHLPYLSNPQGGYSAAGNPGTIVPLKTVLATGESFRDPNCGNIGGFAGFSGNTPICYWQYTNYDNLVEDESHYQVYGQVNFKLSDKHNLHLEALYAKTDVPHWRTSPSYAFLQVPTAQDGGKFGNYFIPANNPGLIAFQAANPTIAAYIAGHPASVPSSDLSFGALLVAARPFGLGGNPLFNFDSSRGDRHYEALRLSAGLNGEVTSNINYDVAVTYSTERSEQGGRDTIVERFQRALRGLGGPDCPLTGGTPGVGPCMFYNPFGNAIPGNPITGQTNPGYNSAVNNNNPALINWFFPFFSNTVTTKVLVVDAVLNGKLGIHLPGGDVGWAAGGQFRENYYTLVLDPLADLTQTPCIDSVDFHDNSCLSTPAGATSPFVFLGGAKPLHVTNKVWAVFGELSLPITDTLNAQLAARYEDYGGGVGSTFNPQIRGKWQVLPVLAFRGSVGTTFRAPPPTQTDPGNVTSLQNIGGTFRAVRIFGNPNLKPEKATTFNVGAILEMGHLTATLDYWNFNFKAPIVTEPVAGMVAAMFPSDPAVKAALLAQYGVPNNCLTPADAALLARFSFTSSGCGIGNVVRLDTNYINGAGVKTDGLDFSVDYRIEDVWGGTVRVGGDATWVHKYSTGAQSVAGVLVQAPFNGVGFLNYQTTAYPLPQWKGSVFLEYSHGIHNLRATVHYIEGYTDQRTDVFATGAFFDSNKNPVTVSAGKHIGNFATVDLSYRALLPWNTTFTLSATNLLDQDPPFARLDLNYDPFTASALGRVVKVGIDKKF